MARRSVATGGPWASASPPMLLCPLLAAGQRALEAAKGPAGRAGQDEPLALGAQRCTGASTLRCRMSFEGMTGAGEAFISAASAVMTALACARPKAFLFSIPRAPPPPRDFLPCRLG